MDYLQRLVVACFLASGSAHAAYAQLAPPAGWTSTPGASGTFAIGNASNAATLSNGTVRTNAALNVGGRAISVPASMRFAANAPRIAAAVIFNHPAVRTATGIATLIGLTTILWDEGLQAWIKPSTTPGASISDGYKYRFPGSSAEYSSVAEACSGGIGVLSAANPGVIYNIVGSSLSPMRCSFSAAFADTGVVFNPKIDYSISRVSSSCPAGWYVTPAGCVQNMPPRKLTEEEFVEELAPLPMPQTVPRELPNKTPLPVQPPVINPTPGDNPSPSPLFVPTGDPVRNPNYNPDAAPGPNNQPWLQPGVRVTPRPTPSNPWQVDLQPVDRPQAGPEPLPEQNPEADPNDKPKEEDSKSLCEKHPDIVACQKLGDLTPQNLAKNTVSLQINREEGFGPANGACPAPKQFTVMGKSMAFRWDLLCDFATQIRPLLVGFAYLSAALAFFGLSRKD